MATEEMESSFHHILTSPIFTFRVGTDGTDMMLPKILVANQSATLNALVNGAMSEAADGVARIEDVDEATFVRFGQWLYTGKYELHGLEHTEHQLWKGESVVLAWDHGLNNKERKRKAQQMRLEGTWQERVTQENLYMHEAHCDMGDDVFISSPWGPYGGGKRQQAWSEFTRGNGHSPSLPPRPNHAAVCIDYTEIFLGHARLYCFADKYGIPGLASECLKQLKLCLIDCECHKTQIQGIVDLVAFTADTTPLLQGQQGDSLRSVVLDFVVIIYELIAENKTFQEVLEDNGQIASKLLLAMRRRLD